MTTLIKLTSTAAISALLLAGCANDTMTKDSNVVQPTATVETQPITATPVDDGATVVTVGNAPMFSNRNVVANASTADNLTTLVAAVKAAELVETLQGPGPFTIFAPVNSAFDALPAGTVDTLLQPENKADLQGVLTYHVVPGTFDTDAIVAQKGSNLSTSFTTVQGGTLSVQPSGDTIYVIDAKGNAARVLQSNVYQSNGVVHVIDGVLLP